MTREQFYQPKHSKKVNWYRVPVDRETLKALHQRSDWQGLRQILGHVGLVLLTGSAAWYAAERLPWPILLLILLLHGMFYVFLFNGSHELSHYTVFKTKALNTFFLYTFCFFVWRSHVLFSTSHAEHHKYTLHPPDDLEVELPLELSLKGFLRNAIVDPWLCYSTIKATIRLSLGKLEGEWEHSLFPESETTKRKKLFAWARVLLVGHALIIGLSIYFGWWMLPVLTTFAPFYGGWLRYLCNNTQHVGLQDNVPDFRLCCRTMILSPFVSFLYWHMNYHIEHHMYPGVPCYNLAKLHEAIKPEMPECPVGLYEAWREIVDILRKQEVDPTYQYAPELPRQAIA